MGLCYSVQSRKEISEMKREYQERLSLKDEKERQRNAIVRQKKIISAHKVKEHVAEHEFWMEQLTASKALSGQKHKDPRLRMWGWLLTDFTLRKHSGTYGAAQGQKFKYKQELELLWEKYPKKKDCLSKEGLEDVLKELVEAKLESLKEVRTKLGFHKKQMQDEGKTDEVPSARVMNMFEDEIHWHAEALKTSNKTFAGQINAIWKELGGDKSEDSVVEKKEWVDHGFKALTYIFTEYSDWIANDPTIWEIVELDAKGNPITRDMHVPGQTDENGLGSRHASPRTSFKESASPRGSRRGSFKDDHARESPRGVHIHKGRGSVLATAGSPLGSPREGKSPKYKKIVDPFANPEEAMSPKSPKSPREKDGRRSRSPSPRRDGGGDDGKPVPLILSPPGAGGSSLAARRAAEHGH